MHFIPLGSFLSVAGGGGGGKEAFIGNLKCLCCL